MTRIVLSLFISALCIYKFNAQVMPQGMKYQAVARDLSGTEIVNQLISLKMTLHSETNASNTYYIETHDIRTNEFGLFSLNIGEGNVQKGEFEKIPWDKENIWIEIAFKEQGDKNYTVLSNSKLLAVPYAYHATTAGALSTNSNYNNNDNGPQNGVPSQNWSLFGNSKSDPDKDKLGTTDLTDLVIVTDNVERVRILKSGEMEVRENAQFDKNINVDKIAKTDFLVVADGPNDTIPDPYPRYGSIADIRGLLIADSIAIRGGLDIGGNLKVHGDSVIVDHHLLVGERTFLKGQVSIKTQIPLIGGQSNFDAYPLKIEGSDQGIGIKVNGERNTSKNFVTFWDNYGIQGRIEGQTSEELHDSFQYIWDNVMSGLDVAFIVAEGVACGFQLDWGEVGVMGAEGASAGAQWAELNVNANSNVGVAFESGNGDYAEWLEKENVNETFSSGDIVGVKGGKISKKMINANHFMVVSKSPIVLGNMPPDGKDANFEKIAFMGQVPVKVRGKVAVGDYIIASNLNDGFGIAVSSKDITLNQFERIVGVAWSESANEFGFSMINVAVGINTNDVVIKLKQQDEALNMLKGEMNNLITYLKSKDESFEAKLFVIKEQKDVIGKATEDKVGVNKYNKSDVFNRAQKILQDNPQILEQILSDTRKSLDEKGINYNKFEQTKRLVTDKTYFMSLLENKKN